MCTEQGWISGTLVSTADVEPAHTQSPGETEQALSPVENLDTQKRLRKFAIPAHGCGPWEWNAIANRQREGTKYTQICVAVNMVQQGSARSAG